MASTDSRWHRLVSAAAQLELPTQLWQREDQLKDLDVEEWCTAQVALAPVQ